MLGSSAVGGELEVAGVADQHERERGGAARRELKLSVTPRAQIRR
jgi:hypothetical protein